MRLKLDENLGRTPQRLLEEHGHSAENVYDEALSGAADRRVWAMAKEEGRFFITLDTDFADVRRYEPGTHPGILLLRPRSGSAKAATALLRRLLERQELEELRGSLTVASEGHTRIRRPPQSEG